MSKEAFEKIHEGMSEVLVYATTQRAMFDQVTIALNALQAIALGQGEAKAIAKDALVRIVDLIPSTPDSEEAE